MGIIVEAFSLENIKTAFTYNADGVCLNIDNNFDYYKVKTILNEYPHKEVIISIGDVDYFNLNKFLILFKELNIKKIRVSKLALVKFIKKRGDFTIVFEVKNNINKLLVKFYKECGIDFLYLKEFSLIKNIKEIDVLDLPLEVLLYEEKLILSRDFIRNCFRLNIKNFVIKAEKDELKNAVIINNLKRLI